MEIGVLDIGTTTVNLLEASVDETGLLQQREALRFVRLGERTLVSGVISQDAWHTTLSSIEGLLAQARKRPERLLVIATSVLRETSNAPAFRKAIEQCVGASVRVLSACEEATLVYAGARSTLWDGGNARVVFDLGGGTLNCALGRGESCLATAALPLGIARLWPAFSPSGALSPADAGCLRALTRRSLSAVAKQANEIEARQVVLSSGHARAVREFAMRRSGYGGSTGFLELRAARAACEEVIGRREVDLVARGVRPELAAVFAIATVVICSTMEELGCSRAVVVDRGLREGAALACYCDAVSVENHDAV